MSIRVTIETASKAEAQLIAEALPIQVEAQSWRGLGVIRIPAKSRDEARELIASVSRGFHDHGLRWARVRYGDEERVFKANGNGRRPG
jgi:hypothetical protein